MQGIIVDAFIAVEMHVFHAGRDLARAIRAGTRFPAGDFGRAVGIVFAAILHRVFFAAAAIKMRADRAGVAARCVCVDAFAFVDIERFVRRFAHGLG